MNTKDETLSPTYAAEVKAICDAARLRAEATASKSRVSSRESERRIKVWGAR